MSKVLDQLVKNLHIHVRSHDESVINSYSTFVKLASKGLGLRVKVNEPKKFIERWTVLKSRFSNRKHMRQYEMRTHFREYEYQKLTGSTTDTLLEYLQRNLPEGVAMHVEKTTIKQLPEFILQDMEKIHKKEEIKKQE
jgi:ribosomal protein S10